jgi:uncharacterized protein
MLLALLLILGVPANRLPDYTDYVVDRAGLLDSSAKEHIKQVASQLDHAGIAQLAVATVPESALDEDSIEDYSVALFKKWGLGHGAKRDDGLLVLFVPGKPGHRKIRIEVGYGLEGILPDGKVGQIRTEQAFPYMKNNDYSGAAVHVVDAIAALLQADAAAGGDTAPTKGSMRGGKGIGQPGAAGDINAGGLVTTILCMLSLVVMLIVSASRRQFPGKKTQVVAAGLTGVSLISLFVASSGAGWLALVIGLIVAAVIWMSIRSHRCPKDGSWMTIDEEVLDPPTYWSEGVAHVTLQCTNRKCGYRKEFDKAIPRKQMTIVTSGGGGGGGGGGGDGFSGGGGGRSGGGGASGEV